MSSKERLVEALKSSERVLVERLRALPAAEFGKGAYESGWNRRQILAHVASIERTYPQLIAIARGDLPMPEPAGMDQRSTEEPYRPSVAGPIHASNQRQVDKLTDASATQLLALFEKNRAATIAAVQGADDALFEKQVRTTGGLQGSLGQVLQRVAVDPRPRPRRRHRGRDAVTPARVLPGTMRQIVRAWSKRVPQSGQRER